MEKIVYEILEKIESKGYLAYLVGGYVRDDLLKKTTDDVDICTNARPKEIMNLFKENHPISSEYGNVVLDFPNFKCEITTFRKDTQYKDSRKPEKIEYVDTLDDDLLRRDFTVNAICMNKEGILIDKLEGIRDLKKKIIRTIGDANQKIDEDALRILRAVRFATTLNFKIDEDLKKAIINHKSNLKKLSYNRKKEELNKIFMSENKKYGIKLLKELDLVVELDLINIDNALKTNDLIGIWGTITPLSGTYPFTKNEKKLMKDLNDLLNEDISDIFILYKYGIYLPSIICDLKKINKKKITKIYNKLPIKDRNEIKITAEEICDLLDLEPDRFLKEIYDSLEVEILNKRLKNDNIVIKEYIKNKYAML